MVAFSSQLSAPDRGNQDLSWWIKVTTYQPACTYFFGPFESRNEAIWHQPGFLEDLQAEQPMGLMVDFFRGEPEALTIVDTAPS
ncbi:hypothetical protein C7271_07410 [filamentous cyanobacterium CCP5]|nr:hypothetical protein C7271_07410 [filamentous cyanobacterium CCP5]